MKYRQINAQNACLMELTNQFITDPLTNAFYLVELIQATQRNS